MNLFFIILFSIPCLAIMWWVWAHSNLGKFGRARVWRTLLAVWCGVMLAGYVWVVGMRAELWDSSPPLLWLTPTFIWTMVVFPGCLFASVPLVLGDRVAQLARRRRVREPAATTSGATPPAPDWRGRRAFLGTLIAAPPALTIMGSAKALAEMDSFRVRRIDVPFDALPRDLDGVTIAQLADIHVGHFSSEKLLRRISDVTNSLKPDIVLSTGDLIDHALADLPAGAATLNRTSAPYGVYVCEGNHDLFESRKKFAAGLAQAGVPLIQNDRRVISIRGVPVELLGLCWGRTDRPRSGAELAYNTDRLFGGKRAGEFSILLAHHPHSFDAAAEAGVDLTLSGHTHGGQINPLPGMRPISLMYKYISGLYSEGKSRLVVSNGIGNWFPIRLNAPAEIVLVTLRRA
ncbi:MAG: metallophosphoesterase [Phycisphaerales bacterium]|jgi:hypothetical protein